MPTQAEKGDAFAALHRGEPFVIPNPWDAGSARMLEQLGFRALATTSSGFAFTLGRLDGERDARRRGRACRALDGATELPVSVDLENGYGAETERRRAAIGAVADGGRRRRVDRGLGPGGQRSTSSSTPPSGWPRRPTAARELRFPFMLTARAENHIRGNPDLDDTIARLQAYEAAGADVLYAPGLETADEIRAVCAAVSQAGQRARERDLTFAEMAEAGAQRVSVGGALTWVAVESARRGGERDARSRRLLAARRFAPSG